MQSIFMRRLSALIVFTVIGFGQGALRPADPVARFRAHPAYLYVKRLVQAGLLAGVGLAGAAVQRWWQGDVVSQADHDRAITRVRQGFDGWLSPTDHDAALAVREAGVREEYVDYAPPAVCRSVLEALKRSIPQVEVERGLAEQRGLFTDLQALADDYLAERAQLGEQNRALEDRVAVAEQLKDRIVSRHDPNGDEGKTFFEQYLEHYQHHNVEGASAERPDVLHHDVEAIYRLVNEGGRIMHILRYRPEKIESIPRTKASIAAIMWYLMAEAAEKRQGFNEGTHIIFDPAGTVFDFETTCETYTRQIENPWLQAVIGKMNLSSHFTHLLDAFPAHGVMILPHEHVCPGLPENHHTVLFGQLPHGLMYNKGEEHDISTLSEWLGHTSGYFRSLYRKAFGSNEGEAMQKERVPKSLLKSFEALLRSYFRISASNSPTGSTRSSPNSASEAAGAPGGSDREVLEACLKGHMQRAKEDGISYMYAVAHKIALTGNADEADDTTPSVEDSFTLMDDSGSVTAKQAADLCYELESRYDHLHHRFGNEVQHHGLISSLYYYLKSLPTQYASLVIPARNLALNYYEIQSIIRQILQEDLLRDPEARSTGSDGSSGDDADALVPQVTLGELVSRLERALGEIQEEVLKLQAIMPADYAEELNGALGLAQRFVEIHQGQTEGWQHAARETLLQMVGNRPLPDFSDIDLDGDQDGDAE